MRNTERARGVSLSVSIDDQDGQASHREAGSKIHGRRRLTDAPLLVRDGNDARVLRARERRAFKHGQIAHVPLDLGRERGVVGTHVTPS